jgi:two-component system response regulator HydG
LLRAIQQREVTRVGGEAPIEVDCRIVCATNQPLAALVRQGRFRQDLYYRLNNLTLEVPPLRDRPDDIRLLVEPILAALRIEVNRELTGLSPRFHEKLLRHAWPGNVRELQHVIHQAAFREEGPVLEGIHFQPEPVGTAGSPVDTAHSQRPFERPVPPSRHERATRAVLEAEGNKSRAATALGISRKTLYQWIREGAEHS